MWLALSGLAIAVIVSLAVGFIWGMGKVLHILSPFLWPLAVAGILSYLLDPVVDFIERRGASRSRAIIAVFALALVVVVALFSSVVPRVVNEAGDLADRIPAYATKLQARITDYLNHPPEFLRNLLPSKSPHQPTNEVNVVVATNAPADLTATNVAIATSHHAGTNSVVVTSIATVDFQALIFKYFTGENLQSAAGGVTTVLGKAIPWVAGRVITWFGLLAGLALIPVYTFYFLHEKKGISSHWADYLPVSDSKFKHELVFILNSINNYLIAFFRGQVLVAICDGIMYTIGFSLIGLPYSVLIGAMSVFLTMIPFIGAIVTCAAALIISLVVGSGWKEPTLVLTVFAIVQTIEGLFISPRIMGDRVGLHPLTIIIAVMAGTTLLGGVLGGILAIPLTAALRVVMFRYVWRRPDKPFRAK